MKRKKVDYSNNYLQEKVKVDKFFIFLMTFGLLLAIGVLLGVDYDELSSFEKIIVIFPAVFISLVGISLWRYFGKQVVDIKVIEDGLLFIRNNGKCYRVIDNIVEVQNMQSTYVFYLSGEKIMTAYKYMPFDPFEHKEKMDLLIERLIDSGSLKIKKYKLY